MSLWAASIDGHVGYSGSLQLLAISIVLLVVIKFCSVLFCLIVNAWKGATCHPVWWTV